jgi:acyl carrier protein
VTVSRDAVRDRIVGLVKQVLGSGDGLDDPTVGDRKLSELGVSSLKMVNLMLAVEMDFDLTIPQDEITPENFHSIASIEAMLHRLLP